MATHSNAWRAAVHQHAALESVANYRSLHSSEQRALLDLAEQMLAEIAALEAENEQKQAQILLMRPIVEAVAADLFTNIDTYERCGWRDGCRPVWSEHFAEWRHAPDCPVTQARAYVAAHPAAGEAVESEGE